MVDLPAHARGNPAAESDGRHREGVHLGIDRDRHDARIRRDDGRRPADAAARVGCALLDEAASRRERR